MVLVMSKMSQLPFSQPCPYKTLRPRHGSVGVIHNGCLTGRVGCVIICRNGETLVHKRSPQHYQRNIWTHNFVESLHSDYKGKGHERIDKLKEEVKGMLLDEMVGALGKLELIDTIQRLGVGYHFENEIVQTLHNLWFKAGAHFKNDLHSVALYFRLLRQHGYRVPQDLFNGFKDNQGNFQAGVCKGVKGILSFHEASHLCLEGEGIMCEAKTFSSNHLRRLVKDNTDSSLVEEMIHSLELPLHWRMQRLESRSYIDSAHSEDKMNPSLLEFAKLDFNLVQAKHKKELKELSRWWTELGLAKNLSFARDRLVESFLYSLGITFEPQYERCREWITKVISLIITIDDIYDIEGSLDEVTLFTAAVERWDDKAVEQLPDYMKICYLALYNTTNDMASTAYKEQNRMILPFLRKVWEDFCKAMLLEAKWTKNKHTPSLNEYLCNGWISSSSTVVLVHAFFATNQKITDNVLECLYNNYDPIYTSSLIFRLCNDLATSSAELERGDVPSAVQCYMTETNTSEQIAREKINDMISNMWKKLNKSLFGSPFGRSFVNIVMNHARTAHAIYQHGDGIGVQDYNAKGRVTALLVKPVVC